MARYSGQFLAPAEGFCLWKKNLFFLYHNMKNNIFFPKRKRRRKNSFFLSFAIWGYNSLARDLQSTPFQNPGVWAAMPSRRSMQILVPNIRFRHSQTVQNMPDTLVRKEEEKRKPPPPPCQKKSETVSPPSPPSLVAWAEWAETKTGLC